MSLKSWLLFNTLRLNRSLSKIGLARYYRRNATFEADLMHALDTRKSWDTLSKVISMIAKAPEDVEDFVEIKGGIRTHIFSPKVHNDGVILFIHGGGWRLPAGALHTVYASKLAKKTKMSVWLVDYRLSPEHPFPAGLLDVADVYKAMLAEGHDPSKITVIGDSAGGNLTLALLLKLKADNLPMPAGAISISPATDTCMLGESYKTKKDVDPVLLSDLAEPAFSSYMRDASPDNPLVSPLYGDLEGLPPLLIMVGGLEILLDDSVRFAEKARKAGVDVTLDVHDEMYHCYPLFHGVLEEAKEAMDKIALFILVKTCCLEAVQRGLEVISA